MSDYIFPECRLMEFNCPHCEELIRKVWQDLIVILDKTISQGL